ncbi:MAG: recombinase RecA [Chitinophagaceae bacterium]|nr:recombinase RecA [Chitinophagaceae bacterium]
MSGNNDKLKALKLTMDKIEKDYGKGSVMMMNEKGEVQQEVISTGSIALDSALGIGGLPKGRIVEIYGPESSGKTTIAIHVIAEAQKKGGMCAIIDAEHAFDSSYAQKLGVDVENLLISQPDYGEQALEIADRLILSGALDVVVIDSVAALVPKSELEGEMGDSKMGLHARLMSQALRKLTATIAKTNTICIFINQLREKLGIINKSGSWYSYNDDKLGQGRESVKQLMLDNPELASEIETKIREKIKEAQAL